MKVKCTRSNSKRFTVGKIYTVGDNGQLRDELGETGLSHPMGSFEAWYKDCYWDNYDFELVEESEMFKKEDIRSGDKIATRFGKGIVVAFGDKLFARYDDSDSGHDSIEQLPFDMVKRVVRPEADYQLRSDSLWEGKVVFDRSTGIGCELPAKEISLEEATKLLTEKFGKDVKIRVNK